MNTIGGLSSAFFKDNSLKELKGIGCLEMSLGKFCKTGKKDDAFTVYYSFCEIFKVFGSGYDTMSKLLEFLSDHEYHSGELLTKHRDHYSHSVYVFALGLSIYANDKGYRNKFHEFYKTERADSTQFLHLWGLTALFHDIGYPFQLAHEQIKAYSQSMWGEENTANPFVSYDNMSALLTLNEEAKKSCGFEYVNTVGELLAYGINKRLGYPLHILLELLVSRHLNQRHFMDHAFFSAVLLANKFCEFNVKFTSPIVDVLTAIALHNNLNRYDLNDILKSDIAVPLEKHPLSYLLILCDELQNWDRTAFGYVSKKDPLAWRINLSVTDNAINIEYIFDSFTVVDSREVVKADGKVHFKEYNRKNANVEKLKNGSFVSEICKLIRCHTKLVAVAKSEAKNKKVQAFASSDKFINLCDFARAIHRSYQSVYGGDDFENLSLEFKLSNIEQAKSYAEKLEKINCFYSDKELDYPVVKAFTDRESGENGNRKDLGFLAREEHLRWVREKLSTGWAYGKDYKSTEERDAKKIHKSLKPFDFLSKKEQGKDELMVRNMIPFLYKYGHGVRIYSFRGGRKPVLEIAGCGHGIITADNGLLKKQIKDILQEYQKNYSVALRTNFAYGADWLIVECAIELGITVKAVLPLKYEKFIKKLREDAKKQGYNFDKSEEMKMRHLLAQAVTCRVAEDKENSYAEALKYIISRSNKMIVLCDGTETENQSNALCIAKQLFNFPDSDIHVIRCERE